LVFGDLGSDQQIQIENPQRLKLQIRHHFLQDFEKIHLIQIKQFNFDYIYLSEFFDVKVSMTIPKL
jgi:hypothetical protein